MRYLLIVLVLLNPICHAAELYRWQDEQGQWHFGDAASSTGKTSQVVEVTEESQNIVKMKKIKLPKTKLAKPKTTKVRNKKIVETLSEKKARCDKKREELRFQAFKYEERNQYDRECVSGMKW